jgi:hypothetical protein
MEGTEIRALKAAMALSPDIEKVRELRRLYGTTAETRLEQRLIELGEALDGLPEVWRHGYRGET